MNHVYSCLIRFIFLLGFLFSSQSIYLNVSCWFAQGYSTSETWYAILDYGTNYCNLHNLITGQIIIMIIITMKRLYGAIIHISGDAQIVCKSCGHSRHILSNFTGNLSSVSASKRFIIHLGLNLIRSG